MGEPRKASQPEKGERTGCNQEARSRWDVVGLNVQDSVLKKFSQVMGSAPFIVMNLGRHGKAIKRRSWMKKNYHLKGAK